MTANSWYFEALSHHLAGIKLENYRPSSVKVIYNGKVKKISLKRMDITPAGSFIDARNAIEKEIKLAESLYGDQWVSNFDPSFESRLAVVDAFFFSKVEKYRPYNNDAVKKSAGFSRQLNVVDAFFIAKHFFNSYPTFNQVPGEKNSFGWYWHAYVNLPLKKTFRLVKNTVKTRVEK